MREIYRLPVDQPLTVEVLQDFIKYAAPEETHRKHLFDYYCGKQDILDRRFVDETKPNNRVVSPFAHNITDFATGYFTGEPIQYENADATEGILKYNDDASVNTELAKNCSVCGHAYELMYVDKYGELRYIAIEPWSCFMIYDNTIDTEPLYFVRHYKQKNLAKKQEVEYAEVYDKFTFRKYSRIVGNFELIEQRAHNFNEVPAVEYLNNPEGLGDFEPCISLIDAYDVVVSNSVNDTTDFSDAYLVLSGLIADSDDITSMKQKRVLCLDNDATATWLTKNINSQYSEDIKNRLSNSIHKFSNVPDMTDTNFAANASGVAMKYKLLGLEDITAKKECEFRKGLTRRFELIAAYLQMISGVLLDWRNVNIVFTRNLPINLSEVGDALQKFGSLLSKETQLSMLPIDIDVEQELERVKQEKEEGLDDGWMTATPNPFIKE